MFGWLCWGWNPAGWLGRLDDVSALVFQDCPLGMDAFAVQSLNCRYGVCISSDLRKSDAIEVAFGLDVCVGDCVSDCFHIGWFCWCRLLATRRQSHMSGINSTEKCRMDEESSATRLNTRFFATPIRRPDPDMTTLERVLGHLLEKFHARR